MRKRRIVELLIAVALIAFGMAACSVELAPAGTYPNMEDNANNTTTKPNNNTATVQTTNDWGAPAYTEEQVEQPEEVQTEIDARTEPAEEQVETSGNEQPDSGTVATTIEPEDTPQDAGTPQQQLETYADVPSGTIANPSELVSATDVDNHVYSIRTFTKTADETLESWSTRSYYGNSFAPATTEHTTNGKLAMLYSMGDDGSFPNIHALIATDEFVYRIDWANPEIPSDFTAAIELLRENREQYFVIPDHFVRFVHELTPR
jgi:hypothetical protein